MVLPACVSSTVTVFRLALATNSNFPERVSAISHGCSWVGHLPTTWLDFRSITATADPPRRWPQTNDARRYLQPGLPARRVRDDRATGFVCDWSGSRF